MSQEWQTANVGELRKSGIVKLKEKDMYSAWVKTACCNLTSEQLRKIADIADRYARGQLLFTTRQTPHIPFMLLNDTEAIKAELNEVYLQLDRCGPTVRNINVCYDDKICPDAVTNCISLAEKLDNFFYSPSAHKVKIGVAGCKKDCVISRVLSDIGFVGVERDGNKGYNVYLGGRLGVNSFVGVLIAECLPEEECERLVQNYFDFLGKEGKEEERAADLVDRLGMAAVKQELTRGLDEGPGLTPIECQTRLQEQETDKTILRIRATCGEVSSGQLRKIADIAEKYGKSFVHFVVRGSPEIPGVDRRHLEEIRQELREVGMQILDRGVDNLQTCYGNYCSESSADTQSLLRRIEAKVEELGFNDLNIRISASGCPNSCAVAHLNDIGFFGVVEPEIDESICNGCGLCLPVCKRKAIEIVDDMAVIDKTKCSYCGPCIAVCPFDAIAEKRKGLAVLVGGREGEDTRLGEVIAEFLSEDEALRITEQCLKILEEKQASAASVIDEVGIEKFKEMLVTAIR